ncbi:MAG: iron chelate uptake ABC transporter family permease subunit [Porphyromonas endodontalis]
MQAIVQNPLADPYILGVSAGQLSPIIKDSAQRLLVAEQA